MGNAPERRGSESPQIERVSDPKLGLGIVRTKDFTLAGFSQEGTIRHFSFRGINVDRSHSDFIVDADTNLIRGYGISLQDLPLLCRRLLEETLSLTPGDVVIFSEELMRQHANQRTTNERIAEQMKQARKKPDHNHLGQGWRAPSS